MTGGRKFILGLLLFAGAIYVFGERSDENASRLASVPPSPPQARSETYRLVHAIGNTEKINAKGLSHRECETRKKELKAVATALGSYNEATGYGSIACLPEGLFDD